MIETCHLVHCGPFDTKDYFVKNGIAVKKEVLLWLKLIQEVNILSNSKQRS